MTKEEIVDAIGSMSLLDVADLVKLMEDKFGVSAAAPVMAVGAIAGAPGAAAGGGGEEEKTEFDVILTNAGEKKIQVLKVVREVTGLGLKEAKDLVDNPPKPLKEKVKKDEAQQIAEKLKAEGATVEIK
ncbi:MAG: 50S ribosomal protein L7/L12 [Cyanobacteria bacterium REEB65]|nr:50S ribosomal protein L7/L12 [Cyanobacteria bacterium REEB65]